MEQIRVITEKEEEVIRLCHHDFQGLTHAEAARKLNVSRQRVESLLKSAKRKAPQMFPILSPLQGQVYKLIIENGSNYDTIATLLHRSKEAIYGAVYQLREKGFNLSRPDLVRYDKNMHSQPKEKF